MRRTRSFLLLLGLLWLVPATLSAATLPKHEGYVTDLAGMLSPATEQRLEQALQAFEASDSTQITVLTVNSLDGDTVEGYALRVAEAWGIGQKGRDNGALLLVAKAERKVRIEVGYGLEGRLTDLVSGRIIREEIGPRFRQGDFDRGIAAGVEAMIQAVRGEYQGTSQPKKERSGGAGLLFQLLFLAPMLLSHHLPATHRRGRRGGFWFGGPGGFGGGGGGGFGGFSGGGGGFGGGGASGSW